MANNLDIKKFRFPSCTIRKDGSVEHFNPLFEKLFERRNQPVPENLFKFTGLGLEALHDGGFEKEVDGLKFTFCPVQGSAAFVIVKEGDGGAHEIRKQWLDCAGTDARFILDRKLRATSANKVGEGLLNSKLFSELRPNGKRSHIYKALNQKVDETSFTYLTGDRAFEFSVRIDEGHYLVSVRDVGHTRQLHRNLIECYNRYRSIFLHSQVGMYQSTPEGKLLSVNPAFARILGCKNEKQLKEKFKDVRDLYVDPEKRKQIIELLARDGKIDHMECQLKHLKKGSISVSLNTVAIRDTNDKLVMFEGTVVDLSERENYRQMMKVFQDSVSEVFDGILIADLDDRVFYVNQAFSRLFGYSRDEMVGKKSLQFWNDHSTEVRTYDQKVTSHGKHGFHGELVCRKKNGANFHVLLSTTLIHDNDGKAYATISLARDITEEHNREEQLKEAKNKAELANRLKSNLMANMSHEVRTPLTGIIGFASILHEQLEGNEDQKFYVDNIKQSGERLLETMNNILMVSEIESQKVRLRFGTANIWDITQRSVSFNKPLALKTGLKLKFTGEEKVYVYTDEVLLYQVLNILINNALKFTEEGGVTVDVIEQKPWALVKISDTGVGIAEDFLGQMYEAFSQESDGIRRKFQGVGLGLNICKKYIELIRGNISVESRKNAGTTFTVRIPQFEYMVSVPREE